MNFKIAPDENFISNLQSAVMDFVFDKFSQVTTVLSDAVHTARDNLIIVASQQLSSSDLKTYEKGLKINVINDQNSISWELYLDAAATKIEGFDPFDMIAAGLVRNNKGVKFSEKTGRYYAKIPFKRPGLHSKVAALKAGNIVQALSASPTTRGNLAADLKMMKDRADKFVSQQAKGISEGKVWSITKDPIRPTWNFYDFATKQKQSLQFEDQPSPLMSGITAVKDKGKTAYFTWRTATDPRMPDKPNSWMHPGVKGKGIFENMLPGLINDAQAEIDAKISQILNK